jgi:hypothetical protein
MASTKSKPLPNTSWSALRLRANSLGIPAWKLAEDFGFHELNDELLIGNSEKQHAK